MRDVLISGCGGDGMTAITRGKQEWPTRPWPTDAEVLGEVTWAARTVVERPLNQGVPTKNLIRTVCVTDRAVLGRRTITSVGMADVRSVEVDGRLASFGRSSGRRVSVHGVRCV